MGRTHLEWRYHYYSIDVALLQAEYEALFGLKTAQLKRQIRHATCKQRKQNIQASKQSKAKQCAVSTLIIYQYCVDANGSLWR